MIAAGRALDDGSLVHQGLSGLRWLIQVQTDDGLFAPVGNQGWYSRSGEPARFDQQPIEADATIAACLEAYKADGEPLWLSKAKIAFDWFLGDNAIGQPVSVLQTGACRDGISATSVNGNQGAESTLAWLMAQLNLEALNTLARRRPTAVSA